LFRDGKWKLSTMPLPSRLCIQPLFK
jgi:hypothetical protein